MGDINNGRAGFALHLENLASHLHSELRVQVRKRFVKQKGCRPWDHRPAKGHALEFGGDGRRRVFRILRPKDRVSRRVEAVSKRVIRYSAANSKSGIGGEAFYRR